MAYGLKASSCHPLMNSDELVVVVFSNAYQKVKNHNSVAMLLAAPIGFYSINIFAKSGSVC